MKLVSSDLFTLETFLGCANNHTYILIYASNVYFCNKLINIKLYFYKVSNKIYVYAVIIDLWHCHEKL